MKRLIALPLSSISLGAQNLRNDNPNPLAGVAVLFMILIIVAFVFLIILAVAPIKLYGIHREIKRGNQLLQQQCEVLARIEDQNRVQTAGLVAALTYQGKAARVPDSQG